MYICSKGHEEICCETHYCPMCEAEKEIDRLQREIEGLREDLAEALARSRLREWYVGG